MPRQQYRVTLLVTLDDASEEVRTLKLEGWNANDAIDVAKRVAEQDENVVEVACTGVS